MTTDTELRELLAAATPGPWKSEDIERVRDGETTWDVDGPYGGWVAHTGYHGDAALIAVAVNALPGLLERVKQAEKERDSAQEHLAYHLVDYQLNSEPTGDLAVDMAAWAGRQRDRATRAEAKLDAIYGLCDEMGAAYSFDQWDDLCVRLRSLLQEGE